MQDQLHFFQFIQQVKNFFLTQNFLEITTPPIVENPGMETHIHPFEVYHAQTGKTTKKYLHTSPEFALKKFLCDNPAVQNIFSLNYSFRDEPRSDIHREQFLMLEWYKKNVQYTRLINDCKNLIHTFSPISFTVCTMDELFNNFCSFSILDFDSPTELKKKINKDFPSVPLPTESLEWDDYFFLIFLNIIEPQINKIPALIIKEYPAQLAALSTIKKDDSRVCERFELYLNGVEIANCFNEETDITVIKERFQNQNRLKFKQYHYKLPPPQSFYQAMKNYPQSSGIALGVERLYSQLNNTSFFFE